LLSAAVQLPSLTFWRSAFAVSIGIAKPTPLPPPVWLAIAVLIPMTRAFVSASGPPLLPVLIGASVWISPVS